MVWYMYILWNDYHCKFSEYPSPHIVPNYKILNKNNEATREWPEVEFVPWHKGTAFAILFHPALYSTGRQELKQKAAAFFGLGS